MALPPPQEPRKKGGIRGAFLDLLDKLSSYWEVMVLYVSKNLRHILRGILWATVRIAVALFLLFLGIVYGSFGLYQVFLNCLFSGSSIESAFGVGALLILVACFLLFSASPKKK